MEINLLLNGRMGNNLFQLASLYEIKKNLFRNHKIKIYLTENQLNDLKSILNPNSTIYEILKTANLNIWNEYLPNYKMRLEREIVNLTNLKIPFLSKCINDKNFIDFLGKKNFKKDILIDGYFQFGQATKNIEWNKQFNCKVNNDNKDRICLHIRRTDTFKNAILINTHCSPSYGYYIDCLNIASRRYDIDSNELPLDIYSDNEDWCKKVFQGMKNVNYCSSNSSTTDFIKMINYKKYIISNSTFSYFATNASDMISKNELTICPVLWSNGKTYEELSLLKENWITI